jgi:hypothetical protein
LVRTRMATSSGSVPAPARRPTSPTTALTSRSAFSKATTAGSGPDGRVATSRLPAPGPRPGVAASSRLARARTSGLER